MSCDRGLWTGLCRPRRDGLNGGSATAVSPASHDLLPGFGDTRVGLAVRSGAFRPAIRRTPTVSVAIRQ